MFKAVFSCYSLWKVNSPVRSKFETASGASVSCEVVCILAQSTELA